MLGKTPDSIDMLTLAASVDVESNRFASAQKHLDHALKVDPSSAKVHYYLGLLQMRQPKGDINEAMRQFSQARDSAEVGIDARFALSECMRRRGDVDGAIRELEGALQTAPASMRLRLALLDSYGSLNPPRWLDAERVIREAKNQADYTPDVELLRREAMMWAGRNEAPKAIAAIDEALAASPDEINLVKTQLGLLTRLRKYPQVVDITDKLVAKDKKLWWAYEARAVAKRDMGRKDDAINDFDASITSAVEANNDDAVSEIVKSMGDVIGPEEAIQRILPRSEREDRWKIMVARLLVAQGKMEQAVKTLEQVLAKDERLLPTDREAALRFGGTLYLMVPGRRRRLQVLPEAAGHRAGRHRGAEQHGVPAGGSGSAAAPAGRRQVQPARR